jgi:DNA primase
VTTTSDARREKSHWDAIKARHRLADVARRSGLDIPSSGRVMVCCPNPDHHDSTPSMQLDLDGDHYWCFGCPSHGDVIDWVRDIERVDTATAIEVLDSRRPINAVFASHSSPRVAPTSGREPPQLDRTPAERVAAANTLAWQYYSSPTLHERGAAYLDQRGINVAALETELSAPVVGHTPSSKTGIDGLVTFLGRKGFAEHELIDAGLASCLRDGCVIDFFRDRIIIPVKDNTGAVIGLLGRDTNEISRRKYLNPPTNPTYQKSLVIYRPSRPRLDDQASVIVCEGPIDALAIAAHAAAAGLSRYFAPIAACGRVLSDAQVDIVLAAHPRAPVLAADGDQTGRDANLDWAARMLAKGRESVITTWPEGHDPSSWLADRGPEGLRAVTRRGCLDDHSGVLRPRHCGVVLTEAAFPNHDRHCRPDPRALAGTLQRATANLGASARQRYIAAAASAFGLSPPLLADPAASLAIRARASPHPTAVQPDPEVISAERIPI